MDADMNGTQIPVAEAVAASVARYRKDPHYILQMLREIQEACDWISPEAIDLLQQALRLPRTKIEGVAGFYAFLYTRPRGSYRVLFSDNITDRMLGNMELLQHMCEQLWVERGKTSEDGLVSIDTASCTGMCDQGPALLVNNYAITRVTRARVDEICELIRNKVALADWPREYFRVDDQVQRKDVLLGSGLAPGEALAAASGEALQRLRGSDLARAVEHIVDSRHGHLPSHHTPATHGVARSVLQRAASGRRHQTRLSLFFVLANAGIGESE